MDWKEQIYRKYVSELQTKIIEAYNNNNRKASRAYQDEMQLETSEKQAVLFGASHSPYVEKGRGSGKFPPVKAIEDWIDVKKGLPSVFYEKKKQYAFLIARKIAEEGTKGSNIIENILQEFLSNDFWVMIDEIGDTFATRISNDIVGLIKQVAA